MDGLNKDIFVHDNLDGLSRKELKSKIVANSSDYDFDSEFATFLKWALGSSSSSTSSDDDGDSGTSKSDDGGDGSSSSDSSSSSSSDGSDSSSSSSSDGSGDGDDGEVEEEEEVQEDTHMKMFLEKLAADGTSYVLKRDGKPDLKFEGMDEDGDESCGFDENEANVVDQEDLSSDCESDPRSGRGKGKGVLRADGVGSSGDAKEDENVERRAKGVKNVGKKRNFVEDGKGILVDVTPVKRGGKTANNVEKGKDSLVENVDRMQVKRRKRDVMENKRNSIVEDVDLRPDARKFSRDAKENGRLERRANNVKNVENERSFTKNKRDSSTEELGFRFEKLPKGCLSEHISTEDCDPEYKIFCDHSQVEGENLVLCINGKRVIYGEDDNKSLSDSEVYVLDHAPDCVESNYAPTLNYNAHMEEDDVQCLGSCSAAENPEFRKVVMDVLRKPFNYNEYHRLREDVKLRKPTVRHVDMRSGNTSFQQTTMGKSYLDHYADLKKQFDAFKNDKPRRLNILRGFFFYLKRMADDGKFKPWLDDSCLAIIPRIG